MAGDLPGAAVILALLACAEAPCAAGYVDEGDVCTRTIAEPPESATIADVLATLPPCAPAAPDGGLDVGTGCADGACVGMTAAAISAALDESPVCERFADPQYQQAYVECVWPRGIAADFVDDDQDGVPDTYATSWGLLLDGYAGTTDEGLGLGVGYACFLDAWGEPESVALSHDGAWQLIGMSWPWRGVSLGGDGGDAPTSMYLYAPY